MMDRTVFTMEDRKTTRFHEKYGEDCARYKAIVKGRKYDEIDFESAEELIDYLLDFDIISWSDIYNIMYKAMFADKQRTNWDEAVEELYPSDEMIEAMENGLANTFMALPAEKKIQLLTSSLIKGLCMAVIDNDVLFNHYRQKYNLIVYSDKNIQPIQLQIDKYVNSHLVKS